MCRNVQNRRNGKHADKLAMFATWITVRRAAEAYYGAQPTGPQLWQLCGLVDRAFESGLLIRRRRSGQNAPEYRLLEIIMEIKKDCPLCHKPLNDSDAVINLPTLHERVHVACAAHEIERYLTHQMMCRDYDQDFSEL